MPGPLEGVLVVAVEQAVAGPMASCRLADAGARVIKIERPEGDFGRTYDRKAKGESAFFVWLNRGKESLVLDFKDPADAALLHRLVGAADVFIQNLAPGAMARAGFASAALREANPRLITCDISGYGEEGPYRDMKAYDFLVQCETGLTAVTGTPDGHGRVGVSVCDISAGINAHAAIVEALYERTRSAKGCGLAVSLFDGIADWMNVPYLYYTYGGAAPKRTGLSHPLIAPYGAYPVGDGGRIVIAIQNEREWARFCAQVLERPELAAHEKFRDHPARIANRDEMDAIIAERFARFDMAGLSECLRAAAIAYGRLNEVADLAEHPQLRRLVVASPSGPVEMIAPPVRRDGAAFAPGAVPALGQHSAAIRAEFAGQQSGSKTP